MVVLDVGILMVSLVCFQAEDGIRDLVRSRGLGDVYKRQQLALAQGDQGHLAAREGGVDQHEHPHEAEVQPKPCLLYTSDAADERSSVDLGGRRIIKKKNTESTRGEAHHQITNKTGTCNKRRL